MDQRISEFPLEIEIVSVISDPLSQSGNYFLTHAQRGVFSVPFPTKDDAIIFAILAGFEVSGLTIH